MRGRIQCHKNIGMRAHMTGCDANARLCAHMHAYAEILAHTLAAMRMRASACWAMRMRALSEYLCEPVTVIVMIVEISKFSSIICLSFPSFF